LVLRATIDASDPAEQHFFTTHARWEDGVYIVQCPFKKPITQIGFTLLRCIRTASWGREHQQAPETCKKARGMATCQTENKEERYSRVPRLSDTRDSARGTKGKWRYL